MTLFLRNKNNRSIVDLELYVKKENGKQFVELHSGVIIDKYSEFLLENLDKKEEIIEDFTEISELRGWLWESFFMDDENDGSKYQEVLSLVRARLKETAKKYNLYYVED